MSRHVGTDWRSCRLSISEVGNLSLKKIYFFAYSLYYSSLQILIIELFAYYCVDIVDLWNILKCKLLLFFLTNHIFVIYNNEWRIKVKMSALWVWRAQLLFKHNGRTKEVPLPSRVRVTVNSRLQLWIDPNISTTERSLRETVGHLFPIHRCAR